MRLLRCSRDVFSFFRGSVRFVIAKVLEKFVE